MGGSVDSIDGVGAFTAAKDDVMGGCDESTVGADEAATGTVDSTASWLASLAGALGNSAGGLPDSVASAISTFFKNRRTVLCFQVRSAR